LTKLSIIFSTNFRPGFKSFTRVGQPRNDIGVRAAQIDLATLLKIHFYQFA